MHSKEQKILDFLLDLFGQDKIYKLATQTKERGFHSAFCSVLKENGFLKQTSRGVHIWNPERPRPNVYMAEAMYKAYLAKLRAYNQVRKKIRVVRDIELVSAPNDLSPNTDLLADLKYKLHDLQERIQYTRDSLTNTQNDLHLVFKENKKMKEYLLLPWYKRLFISYGHFSKI